MHWLIAGEEAMLAAGAALARACPPGTAILYLVGDLGAGKTTLARGFLRGLGYMGAVKSPTYTLLEFYDVAGRPIHHFDLYRLTDPSELDDLGIRDCLDGDPVLLIEWPARGGVHVPPADAVLYLDHVPGGRALRGEARSELGAQWLRIFDAVLQPSAK